LRWVFCFCLSHPLSQAHGIIGLILLLLTKIPVDLSQPLSTAVESRSFGSISVASLSSAYSSTVVRVTISVSDSIVLTLGQVLRQQRHCQFSGFEGDNLSGVFLGGINTAKSDKTSKLLLSHLTSPSPAFSDAQESNPAGNNATPTPPIGKEKGKAKPETDNQPLPKNTVEPHSTSSSPTLNGLINKVVS
jgi:hypothetical protein